MNDFENVFNKVRNANRTSPVKSIKVKVSFKDKKKKLASKTK